MQSMFRLLARAAVVAMAAAAAMAMSSGRAPRPHRRADICGGRRRGTTSSSSHSRTIPTTTSSARAPRRATSRRWPASAARRPTSRAAHFPRSLGNYLAATGGRVVTTTDCTPGPGVLKRRAEHLQPGRRAALAHLRRVDAAAVLRQRHVGVRAAPRPGPLLPAHPARGVSAGHGHPAHPPAKAAADVHVDRAEPPPRHARRHPRSGQQLAAGPAGRRRRPAAPAPVHARPHRHLHLVRLDGGSGSLRTPLPFIVISPSTPHKLAIKPLNQFSALRGWEGMLGLPCIANACDVNGTRLPFHL